MAEYPELSQLASQMKEKLTNHRITELDVRQEKCLNMSAKDFAEVVCGKSVLDVKNYGKWIRIVLEDSLDIMLGLGMGADIYYYESNAPKTDRYQCRLELDHMIGFTCHFWWFGHFELYQAKDLSQNKKFQKIGPLISDKNFTFDYFYDSISKKNASVKNAILSQAIVSGIGNAYIHDILFMSNVHPETKCNLISKSVYRTLYEEMKKQMMQALKKNGLVYERDFYGRVGRFSVEDFQVAYKEGKKCPKCGCIINKIKTGNTTSFVCLHCQNKQT